ncbi:MAG: caspase family protein [Deltaproteobacteria bacterium]|jgi:hypothetical protein|nr:caspase family protein [Deltaproteobacteria bacterium]
MPLALAALSAALTAAAWPAFADRHALLIGINDYSGEQFPPLAGSLNDVELMAGVLTGSLGFPDGNVTKLLDSQATRSAVIAALDALAGRIAPGDQVYVHYSGHGSRTCDLNLDDGPRGFDSTLVTFGARSTSGRTRPGNCAVPASESEARRAAEAARDSPDDYDLLDDRVNGLVAVLRAKADLVVFVSDSCHSATITRSADSLASRGVPADGRVNPDAFLESQAESGLGDYVSIGSADLDQRATEYSAPDGRTYGVFTWSWARALAAARPGESWRHAANRAKAFMNESGNGRQTPVLEGATGRAVLEGQGRDGYAYTVLQAFSRGGVRMAEINAGILAGVGPGSAFAKGAPEAPEARLTVVSADALKCIAEVEGGEVAYGDDLELAVWSPPGLELRIRYQAALDGDRGLIGDARRVFEGLGAVRELQDGDDLSRAEVVAWIVRPGDLAPGAGADGAVAGKPVDGTGGAKAGYPGESPDGEKAGYQGDVTGAPDGNLADAPDGRPPFIPPSDPAEPPELWLVSPAEDSFLWGYASLRAPLAGTGPSALRRAFERAARAHGVMTLEGPPGPPLEFEASFLVFRPASDEEWATAPQDRRFPAAGGAAGRWVLNREIPVSEPEIRTQGAENLVVVKARNLTTRELHVSAVNVAGDGGIVPFLPMAGEGLTTELPAGAERVFSESALVLEAPREFVRVFATREPLDVAVLAQPGSGPKRGAPPASADPLSLMLYERATLTRSASPPTAAPGWATAGSFFVR